MNRFRYHSPTSVEDAVSLLREHGPDAQAMAGGTDIVDRMKSRVTSPNHVVNIKKIHGLSHIRYDEGQGLRVGSLTKIVDLEESPLVLEHYPALAQAASRVASPQIRNMATVAGNLCQDVWCWYYRTGLDCWRAGGKTCLAVNGDNRYYHIVVRGVDCFAVHPADLAPVLVALEAMVKVVGPKESREMPLEDLYPHAARMVDGQLKWLSIDKDEIISEIVVPSPRPGTKASYLKYALRGSWDFSIVNATAVLKVNDGIISDSRIILGGIDVRPYRSRSSEAVIKGKALSESLCESAGQVAVENPEPLGMNAYKLSIASALVKRVLLSLA